MKPVDDPVGISDKIEVALLTGDGRRDRLLFKGLVERYNGAQKMILLPASPFLYRPSSGVSALKATKTFMSQYRIMQTLFVVDKEHASKDIEKKVTRALGGCGIRVQHIEKDAQGAALIARGLVITRKIIVYIAVLGKEKCIEEEEAELISLEFGEKVKPNKKAVQRALNKRDLNLYTLVMRAKKKNLPKAFPSLCFMLATIEKDNNR